MWHTSYFNLSSALLHATNDDQLFEFLKIFKNIYINIKFNLN